MKQGMDTCIIRNDAGQVVAVNLGADFYSEHEHGIQQLQESLGIKSRKISNGEHCTIKTNLDSKGQKYKLHDSTYKLWGLYVNPIHEIVNWRGITNQGLCDPHKEQIHALWDDRSFAFMVEDKKIVQDFAEAFEKNDISIWIGKSGTFNNGGLIIAIDSRLNKFKKWDH